MSRRTACGGICFVVLGVALVASPGRVGAQTTADSTAIRQVALDYIEGWYDGDEERMHRALHPDLAKRMVWADERGRSHLDHMSAMTLVDATGSRGAPAPAGHRRTEVRILDVFGDAASVRVDAMDWIDYLHVFRWNGEWKIVNVLWELRPQQKAGFRGR